jgi:hypothetical protein
MKYALEFKLECVGKYKNAEYIDYSTNKRIKAKTKWMPPSKSGGIHVSLVIEPSQ